MDIKGTFKNVFLWIVPAILLLLTLFPIPLPSFYSIVLQIVVSLAALYIAYLLFTERPKYYLVWGIVFLLILFVYNPIVYLNVSMGIAIPIPLSLVTAVLFLANWWFVFRSNRL